MDLFNYTDYKKFLSEYLKSLPKKGYGESSRIAKHLDISAVMVSQILKGHKHFNLEQGEKLCSYLGFINQRKDFFLHLISFARAGTPSLQEYYQSKIKKLQSESKDISKRVRQDKTLSDDEKILFYSDWIYSAIRVYSSLSNVNSVDQLNEKLHIPKSQIQTALNFLIDCGLCLYESGKLKPGPHRLHLESTSPILKQRNLTWRLKALDIIKGEYSSINYSAPFSISTTEYELFRDDVLAIIEKLSKRVSEKPPEIAACLNIDLFQF